jgi:anti-sigma regulatory factor (Ser/Thr protein kinase)
VTGELRLPASTSELRLPARTGELRLPARTGELRLPASTGELCLPASTSELRLPAERARLGEARRYAERAAADFGLDADGSFGFVFAVNEAVTNAVRHGAPDAQGLLCLSVAADPERLTFAVRDWGTFALPAPNVSPRPGRGRGFALMASLVDEVELRVAPGCTIVRLSKIRDLTTALTGA